MNFSSESYRTKWIVLVIAWVISSASLVIQARLVEDYLAIAGRLGLQPTAKAETPLVAAYPAFAADAQTWVRHALALEAGSDVRLRYTTIDNAPLGREVHWNSAWAWAIVASGKLRQLFSGESFPVALEKAVLWLPPVVMISLIVLISVWVTKRAGAMIGCLSVAAITGNDRVFEGFFPTYVDHHGLLTIAAFATLLGATFMGAGWWKPRIGNGIGLFPESAKDARTAAIVSGISGAAGLWVSAASVIPPIALVGVGGLLTIIFHGKTARLQGANFDPQTWRVWGRTGAAASAVFYLIEYFPNHLGMRLEANHPLHALAWLGGGELIAEFGARWLGKDEDRFANPLKVVFPLVMIVLAPASIVLGGAKVFVVLDPFMSSLHNDYIQEFLPLWKTMRGINGWGLTQFILTQTIPIVAAYGTLSYLRREAPVTLWFNTYVVTFLIALAWYQSRWLLNATGCEICLVFVILATWLRDFGPRGRWVGVAATIAAFYLPIMVTRYSGAAADIQARRVSPKDAGLMLARDIARTLRESQPAGDITLLSSPNSSTAIGYYGRFKTLGTLYWENAAGLKAAASVLAAKSETEAANLVRKFGITHIAVVSDENFVAEYFRLLNPKATQEDLKGSFGYKILADRTIPQWLEAIPYKVPDEFAALKTAVMLFRVNFAQNLAEALYSVAKAQVVEGSLDAAEQTLELLLKGAAQNFQPWILKGEIQLARRNWEAATSFLLKGIELAPADRKVALFAQTASTLFRTAGQPALAATVYRTALKSQFVPDFAAYLAWILATNRNDAIRNGAEAHALAEAALKTDPNSPTFLSSLGAAKAELGKFNEAIETYERALANARLRREQASVVACEQRIAVLKGGNPIRD